MVHVLMNKSNGFMTVEKVFASSSDMGAVKAMEITSIVAKNVNIDVETFKVWLILTEYSIFSLHYYLITKHSITHSH